MSGKAKDPSKKHWKEKMKDIPGLDTVDYTPDYSKSAEENEEMRKKKHPEVYTEDPPE